MNDPLENEEAGESTATPSEVSVQTRLGNQYRFLRITHTITPGPAATSALSMTMRAQALAKLSTDQLVTPNGCRKYPASILQIPQIPRKRSKSVPKHDTDLSASRYSGGAAQPFRTALYERCNGNTVMRAYVDIHDKLRYGYRLAISVLD